MVDITAARDSKDFAIAAGLIRHYFDSLPTPETAAMVDHSVTSHRVAAELADLGRFFAPPSGQCLIGWQDGCAEGFVMLTGISDQACEMNRMFVTEAARGFWIGRKLCNAIIAAARAMEFRQMTLDTTAHLTQALALYRSVGFVECRDPFAYAVDDPRILHLRLTL